jgi:glycyl-tRNA synthetase beta chain
MTSKSLLVELFVEELPPKSLKKLGEAFGSALAQSLREQLLAPADAAVTAFATPRRLAVRVAQVAARAPDQAVELKLVPVKVGLDASGKPTPVLLKKLESVGADASAVGSLVQKSDGKNDTLFLPRIEPGVTLQDGLQKALDLTLQQLPIPKVMTYQLADGWSNVKFVRPAHGLVALHGKDVVPVQALGLTASNTTHGHRFAAKPTTITLRDADGYERQLADDGAVIASFAERRSAVVAQLAQQAALSKLRPIDDDALLDEVTSLVERPNVLRCRFEPEFLAVPQECLILTMKLNQKYFPLLDADGRLSNEFLVVSNIAPDDASAVVTGNERVVRPRLADARFFFEQDQKKTLAERVPGLQKVVYHNKLGSQGERVERVRKIAGAIGAALEQALGEKGLAAAADRTALLAKADLLTEMVGEFPELQGTMGRYYALHDGEPEAIALAIEDHYKPRFAGDALPRNTAGLVVALADKLETLVGLFGIGQTPTGDKDPFALRRHALGVIRILVEKQLPLDLDALIALVVPVFGDRIQDPSAQLQDFCFDRLAASLREQGFTAQEIDAVTSLRPQRLAEIERRLAAVHAFAALPEAASLAAANKRIGNILKKSDAAPDAAVDQKRLTDAAEKALHQALSAVRERAAPEFARGDYEQALARCASLKAPVDAFFDAVMVNAEDAALRQNRHALLRELHALMNTIADLSKLAAG